MSIFRDTVFLDIVGWTSGDGLLATDNDIQITGSLDVSGDTFLVGDITTDGDLAVGGGSGSLTGSIFAATGSFDHLEKVTGTFKISHPDPSKSNKNLYHSFVESPTAGDNIYRYEIQAFSDNEQVTIDLPDYFRFLNDKPQIFVQALGQFANAYASVDQYLKKLRVVCEKKGFYDVLLIATRKDKDAVQAWSGTERNK